MPPIPGSGCVGRLCLAPWWLRTGLDKLERTPIETFAGWPSRTPRRSGQRQ
jgi:hypothetical protein